MHSCQGICIQQAIRQHYIRGVDTLVDVDGHLAGDDIAHGAALGRSHCALQVMDEERDAMHAIELLYRHGCELGLGSTLAGCSCAPVLIPASAQRPDPASSHCSMSPLGPFPQAPFRASIEPRSIPHDADHYLTSARLRLQTAINNDARCECGTDRARMRSQTPRIRDGYVRVITRDERGKRASGGRQRSAFESSDRAS